MQVREWISRFLSEKKLSKNSLLAYQYDLEQFADQVGETISKTSLQEYQLQLDAFLPSVQKRKISTCNQFLYFLYQKGGISDFHRLAVPRQSKQKVSKPQKLDLALFWEESAFPAGRLLALLIVEMGLLPSELLQLEVADINLDFQVMRVQKGEEKRVLSIPQVLVAELEKQVGKTFLFEKNGKVYSRQWAYRQLESFLQEKGFQHLSAQGLRKQYILGQLEQKVDIYEIAKNLGLKTATTLEKYR